MNGSTDLGPHEAADSTQILEEAMSILGVAPVEHITTGGQKIVHVVSRNGDQFVLKLVVIGSSEPTALGRAQREVELLGQLDSPNVVRVASHLVEIGEPAVAVSWLEELLDGSDISSHLGSPWTWDEAARMAHDVGSGLAAAHALGVVHRDLSPNNVRRRGDGSYVVMDFGFARHTLKSGLTIAGHPGTPGYLSPEHLQSYSGGPTASSDIFCVGILMFAAITGQLPVPVGPDLDDYILRLLHYSGADVAAHGVDLSVAQIGLINRCLHPQPARRFLSGTRLVAALDEVEATTDAHSD